MIDTTAPWAHQLSRRAILQTGASAVLGAAVTAALPAPTQGVSAEVEMDGAPK